MFVERKREERLSLRSKLFLIPLMALAPLVLAWIAVPGHILERPRLTQKLTFVDRAGLPIRAYRPGETYDWLPLSDVPSELADLVVLAEDRNFYHHPGLDARALLRSFGQNLSAGEIVSGASTITQQVYRLGHGTPRSLRGKLTTMIGALKLDRHYEKRRILEAYLNQVPFGAGLAGVKRAGEVFFGKELSLLNLAEFATLAVLPRSPSYLRTHKAELLKRRNALLREYAVAKGLSPAELTLNLDAPVELAVDSGGWDNYHYVVSLLGDSELHRHVSPGGIIRTTLDLYLQREAQAILRSHVVELKKFDVHHGALVVLHNQTGDVLAYVGSPDLANLPAGQIDALRIKRQPGSALKPLTYALALQRGHSLADPLPDIPSYYKTGLGQYLPRNYGQDFSGPRLMREALANSLNLPAVALAEKLGVEEVYAFYRSLGLVLPRPALHYGVGLTLGNVEVTPFDLAAVYTAFPGAGRGVVPRFFSAADAQERQTPLTAEAAFLVSDVLADQVARREEFGERNPFDLPFALSVKTGTSTDFRDNWAVGFNKDFTILVWVGNTDQKPMKRVSGITGAGPVLRDVARYLAGRWPMRPPEAPAGILREEVCSLSGHRPGPHCPHRKLELFAAESGVRETCRWHRELFVRDCRGPAAHERVIVALLPDAYQAFVGTRPDWSVEGQVRERCAFSDLQFDELHLREDDAPVIARPLSGSTFAVDPNLPRALQRLKLELNRFRAVRKVIWRRNGSVLGEGPASMDWPLERGQHSFEAEVHFSDGNRARTPSVEVRVL